MIKRVLLLVILFVLGMLSANMTLGNSGKDCKNFKPCPGNSCDKDNNGHFSRCVQLPPITLPTLPTLTIPTTTGDLPTVTLPTLPTNTTEDEPDTTQPGTTTQSTTTTTTQPNTTTAHTDTIPALPANPTITTLNIDEDDNALKTAGTNFVSSIVGLIIGVIGSWLWCTRVKQ